MKLITRLNRFTFSTNKANESLLTRQLLANSNKNALRFENQNRTWTFSELDVHSNAFAYGLVELGWKKGDKLLLWVGDNHTSEIVTAQIAAAKIGVVLTPITANSSEDLSTILNASQAKGILISPNTKAGDCKYIDVVNATIPELAQTSKGASFRSKFSQLKHVLHTGFYQFPGTYKFRQVMVYASKNFNTLSLPNVDEVAPLLITTGNQTLSLKDLIALNEKTRIAAKIDTTSTVFVSGNSQTPTAFAIGALNSLLHGNYTVFTGAQDIQQVGESLQHYENSSILIDGSVLKNISALKHREQFQKLRGVIPSNSFADQDIQKLLA